MMILRSWIQRLLPLHHKDDPDIVEINGQITDEAKHLEDASVILVHNIDELKKEKVGLNQVFDEAINIVRSGRGKK